MKTALKEKFITEKSFYRNLLAIAGPMAFQYAISFGVTLMDSVMLGSLGDVAISGANLGNQMQTLVMSCSYGLASGGGVLIAQYWGKKDMAHIRKVVRLAVQAVFCAVSVLTLLSLAFPHQILRIFTPDAQVIEAGASYLSVVAFSYLPYALASCYLSSLRGTEQVKMTVGVYGCSFFVNVIFNYIFIFGKLGAPALGVRGAAVGTVCARCSELILALIYMYTKEKLVGFRVKDCFTWDKELLGEYFRHSLPVVGNELLWGFGSTVTSIIMGQISRTFVAASSITMVLHQLSFVTLNGVGNAAAVLTGRTVGEGSYARVQRVANTLVALSFGLGALNCLFILCVRPLFLAMYHVSPAVHEAAYGMIGVLALLQLTMGVERHTHGFLAGLRHALAHQHPTWLFHGPCSALARARRICLPENRQPGEGAFVAHSHQGRALGAQCDRAGGDCNGLRGRKQRPDGRENRAITTKKSLGNGQPAQTFSTPAFRLDF